MNSMSEIQQINEAVISTLKAAGKPNLKDKETLTVEPEIIHCDKCDFEFSSANLLRKHIVNDHSKTFSKDSALPHPKFKQ